MDLPDGVRSTTLQAQLPDRFARLRAELGISSFGINQIVLEPGQRNRIHRHTVQEEVYIVLDGTLTLVVEDESFELPAGSVLAVASEVRRQLVNRGPEQLSLLALGGMLGHQHQGRDAEVFAGWEDTVAGTPQTMPLPDDLPAEQCA